MEKLRYHSYRAGIHLLAGTQQLGLQGYQYWIRDPYNSCWLATNLSRLVAELPGRVRSSSQGPLK